MVLVMTTRVAVPCIASAFPGRRERARAIGVWGGVFGLSIALGPVLGGVLTDSVGWRGIFWVNIPVGLAAIVLSALCARESRAARPRRVDPVGQGLVIVALASLTYAIIEGPRSGWLSPLILGLFAAAVAAVAALILYEPRRREPLLDLRFFHSAPFSGATLIAVSAFAAAGGAGAGASAGRRVGRPRGGGGVGGAVPAGLRGPVGGGFPGASPVGWWIIAGFGGAVLLGGVITRGRGAQATAARTAERIT